MEEFLIHCALSSPVLSVSEHCEQQLLCAVDVGMLFAVEDKMSASCSSRGSDA